MTYDDTRQRLIVAATDLFVRKGYGSVSIREIAKQAGGTSALIKYYFGDKDGLFTHVFKEVAAPMNIARLKNFEQLAESGGYEVEDVLTAWVTPMFQIPSLSVESPVAALSLSLSADQRNLTDQLVVEVYDEVNEQFLVLLERCLPGVSRTTLVWRLYFLVGAVLTATRQRSASILHLTRGATDGRDAREMITHLVAFAASGFRAAEPPRAKQGRRRQVAAKAASS